MKKPSTKNGSVEQSEIGVKTQEVYKRQDLLLDSDLVAPQMPPEYWTNATVGKYYRPLKTQISLQIDNEVLDWSKSKGEGHLSRINEILRERMSTERP